MKRLTLVRHAKSDWSLPGQQDWDRPLNRRGQRDAPMMGKRLRARRLRPDLVLTSPAVRAVTTANILARELRIGASHIAQDERLYLASAPDLLRVVRELGGDATHVMVCGHNPGMTEFCNRLSSAEHIDNLPTCGVFTAKFAIRKWDALDWGAGEDVEFDYPKKAG